MTKPGKVNVNFNSEGTKGLVTQLLRSKRKTFLPCFVSFFNEGFIYGFGIESYLTKILWHDCGVSGISKKLSQITLLKVSYFQNVLMKNQFGQNTNQNISALEVYYFQGRNLRNIFVGILSKLIFHKDILKISDL